MRLRQLEILSAVKECGTISGAAEKLYIAQPSLSTALKELENELGVELFLRTNNGIIFTPAGEEAYVCSQRILKNIEAIQHIPSDHESLESHSISVASNFFSGTNLLVDTILALQHECLHCQKYRFVNTMEKQDWDVLIKSMTSSQLDLAIVRINNYHEEKRLSELIKWDLVFEELYTEQLFVVARKGHPLSSKPITIFDLEKYQCVFEDNNLNDYIKTVYGKEYCLQETSVMESQTGIRRYLASTNAISVMPQYELIQSNYIHGSQLEILQLENFLWTRKIGCLRKKRPINWAEEMFINKLFELQPNHE